jgi:hypothetical protein
MQLTLRHNNITTTIDMPNDVSLDEIFEQFNALLISATFQQASIDSWIIEKADELNRD